ncbi:hypothetical protein D5086_032175 [Populus alba]|uniref:Uncharacterized protein n=1 Tax=Populus alba TaxID=43335 RepID=A0ACC4AKQ1_POPAL
MFLWTSVQYQATAVELGAQLISMDSAQIRSGPAEAATILALSSRQMNTVAILAAVAQQITRVVTLFVTKLGKSPPSSSRSTTLQLKFTCSSSPG